MKYHDWSPTVTVLIKLLPTKKRWASTGHTGSETKHAMLRLLMWLWPCDLCFFTSSALPTPLITSKVALEMKALMFETRNYPTMYILNQHRVFRVLILYIFNPCLVYSYKQQMTLTAALWEFNHSWFFKIHLLRAKNKKTKGCVWVFQ